MEESWYNNSTFGKNYIEISELELPDILSGGITDNLVREGVQMDSLFRF